MKKNTKIPADMQELYKQFRDDKEMFSFPEEWENDCAVIQQRKAKKDWIMFLFGTGLFFLTLLIQMVGKGFELTSLFVVCLSLI